MRCFLVLVLIAIVAVITGCGEGKEKATPTATPAPTLEENTQKLLAALPLDPDGKTRSYIDPEGTFEIEYFSDNPRVDFEVWILETPVKENALKVVEFIHQAGIANYCHPHLRISWLFSDLVSREEPDVGLDDLPPCSGEE